MAGRSILALLLVAGCGASAPTSRPSTESRGSVEVPYDLPTEPACLAPRARPASDDPALDALAFFDGCWSFYDTDWGMDLCGERMRGAWEIEIAVQGPMAAETVGRARIANVEGALVLSCIVPPCWSGRDVGGRLVESSGAVFAFGSAEQRIEFRVEDGCTLAVAYDDGYVQRYHRPTP